MSFNLGFIEIRYYAMMIIIGGIIGYYIAMKRRDRFNIFKDDIENLIILGVPSAIISARIYHIISELDYYFANPKALFSLQFEGLAYFGAFLGMILMSYIYSKLKKIDLVSLLDLAAPSFLIAQAIGRIGNFFNFEIYGFPTDLPWGIYIPESFRALGYEMYEKFHPAFAYEALLNILGFAIILWIENRSLRKKKVIRGTNIYLYLIWYGIVRFLVGFIRIEPDDFWVLNDGQVFALIFLLLGITLLIRSHKKYRSSSKV